MGSQSAVNQHDRPCDYYDNADDNVGALLDDIEYCTEGGAWSLRGWAENDVEGAKDEGYSLDADEILAHVRQSCESALADATRSEEHRAIAQRLLAELAGGAS